MLVKNGLVYKEEPEIRKREIRNGKFPMFDGPAQEPTHRSRLVICLVDLHGLQP